MITARFYLSMLALLLLVGCTIKKDHNENCKNYEEASIKVDVVSNWQVLPDGIHSSFSSSDIRYEKFEIPVVNSSKQWNTSGWRGERLSGQLVLWSKADADEVSMRFTDLQGENGAMISNENIGFNFIRYVITDEFAEGCSPQERKPENYKEILSADVLDNTNCLSIKGKTTQPVWLSLDIPGDAVPGSYIASLELLKGNEVIETLAIHLEVQAQTLPSPGEWAFHLDLWQNPFAVSRVAGVENWSQEHWEELRPVMKMLADAGQKVITTTINKKPWDGQTEDAYESMIEWVLHEDGSWSYDYSVFDNWVQFMFDMGIDKQINCYSMVPWGDLYYYDESKGKEVSVTLVPGTSAYNDFWRPFLISFVEHLEEKGWREITCIAMDEIEADVMKIILDLLDETAPGLGVSLADKSQSYRIFPDRIADLCVAQGFVLNENDRDFRSENGFTTTWYVCCAQEFPNVFTFSDPAEGAFIAWHTISAGLDGFLRWAYNNWVKEPLLDSRFRALPAGDTYIVYPGGRSSVRFEKLREGIQDVEKLRILKTKLMTSSTNEASKKLSELENIMKHFQIVERPDNLNSILKDGKKWLDEVSLMFPDGAL